MAAASQYVMDLTCSHTNVGTGTDVAIRALAEAIARVPGL
jgi:hypothetical protein